MDRKQILIPGSLWQRLLLLVFSLFAATAGAEEAGGPWKKHVVLSAEETGGGVNTVLANDFDGDGKSDIISSFAGKVVLLKGPDWKLQVVVHKLPTNRPGGRAAGVFTAPCWMWMEMATWISAVPTRECSGWSARISRFPPNGNAARWTRRSRELTVSSPEM